MDSKIKFNNGRLKVMQISDLQDTKKTTVDTLRFIDSALTKEKPDFIVMTGDQLDVVGMWGKGEKIAANVRKAITGLFSVFEKHAIPYALTFGNHDGETGMPVEEQAKIYAELRSCISFKELNDGRPDEGTFNVPIFSSDGESVAMNFFFMDCHNIKSRAGYEGPNQAQLDWYEETSDKLGRVPSAVFQHVPPTEIYELFEEVPKGTKKSLPAYGIRTGKFFKLKDGIKHFYSFGETPSVLNANNKEFELMRERGDVFGIFFGHDHYNGFIGNVRGIDLGYCPGAGYNTYGLKNRAVRIFEFNENDIKNYNTYIVDYSDCCKKSETAPIRNFFYCHAPSCQGMAKPFAMKCVAILLAVILAFVLIGVFISAAFVKMFLVSMTVGLLIYGAVAWIYNTVLRRKLIGGKKNG